MALGRRPAGHPVFLYEGLDIAPLQFALLNAQRGDHFIVCLRHVSGAGRLCDIGILHLGGIFVNIRNLQSRFLKGRRHQRRNDILRR